MNVLSLFDGKSSGMTACELAGLNVEKYYSSEINKFANQVSMAIYPNLIRLGDVLNWKQWDLDWSTIDLIIGGSPCQGFSQAGQQLAFDDPRSALFFVYMDIVNHCIDHNPKVDFMLENVKMAKEPMQTISEYMGVNPTMINSNLLSAQNRKRVYWASWYNKGVANPIPQPEDKKIMLIDVLEQTQDLPEFVKYKEKSKCLRVGGGGSKLGDKHEWDSPYCLLKPRGNNVGGIRGENGKVPCLTTSSWQYNVSVFDGLNKRRFTPRECFRLQTTPENIIDKILDSGVSNSQLYKIAGNGWTDEVIAHILKGLK